MRSARRLLPLILSLVTIISINLSVRAGDDDGEDYDVKARVVRVSMVKGEVNLKRNGNTDWERVQLNFPLVEGDTISTNRDSRAEIQIDGKNFVRLDAETMLEVITLRDEGVALSVIQGTASVRLAQFDHDHEYFEVDAPKTTLAAEKKGLYRIDVTDGRVRLTARDGGNARIYSETSGFALRDGRSAELLIDGTDAGDWELATAQANDSWDQWVDDRERYLAQRLRYNTPYYDQYVWGGEDLDSYGQWVYATEYGWIWQPNAAVINSYDNWAPYRYGSWVWCSPYGWTWVGNEPWGWAPYHYGRWVYYNNYWAWCPRSEFYRHRSWWRPALVAFNISFGNEICWYPLSYHHRDPRSRNYDHDRDGRLRALRGDELRNLQRINPANLRAVTAVRAKDFGSQVRFEPAADQLARRVVSAEPLRSDLPVRPSNVASSEARPVSDRIVARPPRVSPDVRVTDRPTGATTRTPGVPLDDELRRTRVLNGRELRPTQPATAADVERNPGRETGVVTRPPRSNAQDQPPTSTEERPSRPDRTFPRQTPDNPQTVQPRDRNPVTIPEQRPVEDRPVTRPEKNERRERIDRPEREVRPPVERPAVEERRSEPRVQRSEPPARNEAPPRNEPAPRNDPPPRVESPRNEPAPRNDPPPRTESPRDIQPARSEPAPKAAPPSRSEPPARVERKQNP